VVDGSPMATTLLLVAVVIVTAMVLDSTNGFMTVTARFGPAPAPPAMATATAAPAIAPIILTLRAGTFLRRQGDRRGVAAPTWRQRSRTGSAPTAINVAGSACPAVFALIGRDGYPRSPAPRRGLELPQRAPRVTLPGGQTLAHRGRTTRADRLNASATPVPAATQSYEYLCGLLLISAVKSSTICS